MKNRKSNSLKLPIQSNLDLTTINNKQAKKNISSYHYKLLINSKLEEIQCLERITEKFNCKLKICEDSINIIDIYLLKIREASAGELRMNHILKTLKHIFPNFESINLKNGLKFFVAKHIYIEINEINFNNGHFEKFHLLKYLKTNYSKYEALIVFLKSVDSHLLYSLQFSVNLLWKSYFISKLDAKNHNGNCPLMFIIENYDFILHLGNPCVSVTGDLSIKIEILVNVFMEFKFEVAGKYEPKLQFFDCLISKTPLQIREIVYEYLFIEGIYDFVHHFEPKKITKNPRRGKDYVIVENHDLIICLTKINGEYNFISNKHEF